MDDDYLDDEDMEYDKEDSVDEDIEGVYAQDDYYER